MSVFRFRNALLQHAGCTFARVRVVHARTSGIGGILPGASHQWRTIRSERVHACVQTLLRYAKSNVGSVARQERDVVVGARCEARNRSRADDFVPRATSGSTASFEQTQCSSCTVGVIWPQSTAIDELASAEAGEGRIQMVDRHASGECKILNVGDSMSRAS